MKKICFTLIGAFLGAFLCVGITWAVGQIFGQLYHGEDEANRNFGIFMFAFLIFLFAGGFLGFWFSLRKKA